MSVSTIRWSTTTQRSVYLRVAAVLLYGLNVLLTYVLFAVVLA